MPVTSTTAKVLFNLGDFDYTTSLTLPPTSASNTVSLRFNELVSDQLSGWGSNLPYTIFGLLRVSFEGEVIYTNADYETPSEDDPPATPDITITPDDSPATVETVVIDNYVDLVTGSDGTLSDGDYLVEIKFVYKVSPTLWETEDATSFTATFSYTRQEPITSFWYDQDLPKLTYLDSQDYTQSGTEATTDTEFVLSPPQNRTEVTNTFEDTQTVSYTSFWTGGNEMTYTILVDYEYTDYVTVAAEQTYTPFTIYYLDWCSTYDCLNTLYDLAIGASCGTKQKSVYEDRLAKATSLIQQIKLGLGCGKDTLSGLIEELNEVLDCDCACLDSVPRQLNAGNIVANDQVQTVETSATETEIDLSDGSTVFVEIDVSGDTTEIQASSIEEYGNYTLILKNDSENPTQTATFETGVFLDPDGDLADVVIGSYPIVVKLFAQDATTLILTSRSDA